jgi:hypothetical protein
MAAGLVTILREQWPFAIETALVLVAFPIAFLNPYLGSRAFEKVEILAGGFARKRGLAVIAIVLLALMGRGALLAIDPIPAPGVHDEFSYLLMGETFASGRLTNPTHPMWKHFESFHINQIPTYCSKYPFAQGLFLAAGEALLGHPWFGVWISAALMCGAICWMLQGWLPPGWALLGGLLAVMRLGLFSYWVDSYWGGAVAAIGGCLALGALGRMKRTIRAVDAVWMGIGVSILANSRPYEGLLLSIGIGVTLLVWIVRRSAPDWRSLLLWGVLPMLIPVSLTAVFMCIYFQSTTGSPFVSPYQMYNHTYGVMPLPNWIWMRLMPAPHYRHPLIKAYFTGWETPIFLYSKTLRGFIRMNIVGRVEAVLWFFLGPALAISLLAAWRIVFDRRIRPLLWIGLFVVIGQSLQPIFNVHYAAPVTGAIVALMLQSFRHLRVWSLNGKPAGRFVVRSIPVICFLMVLVRIVHPPAAYEWNRGRLDIWCCANTGNLAREDIIERLAVLGGRHLVMAHYKWGHVVHSEWVYNAADIDNSNIVFARGMDPVSDRELMEYFKDREVWVLDADQNPVTIKHYKTANGLGATP